MKINKNTKLFLRDLYLYDIEACHYTIMQKLGLDLSHINREDKITRNIQIGQIMRKNPRLTSLLRNTTRSVIDEFIHINKISEDDIILRQYDGIIITKTLQYTDTKHIPLNIRSHFQTFISSLDRQKYIALTNKGKIIVKGVPFRYDEIDKIYDSICKINFARKESIFRNLQKIKDNMINSNDAKLFAVPVKDNKFHIFLKEYGQIEVSKAALKIMDPDDIDKERYFKFYIEPFTKSIVVEFVR
jgi:hypothetical protein